MDKDHTEQIIKDLLRALGQDVNRADLIDTPKRVAASYSKLLEGYSRDLSKEMTIFPNDDAYDDIVYSGHIKYFSTCEHHLLPFFGKAHIAYIPNEKIAGLSKLSRAVDIFSRRLQQQERITVQVADALEEILEPKGVAVFLEGEHLCNSARGVQQFNSNMKTVAFRGVFKDPILRDQFMNLTK